MDTESSDRYRPCVGIVVINQDKKIFIGKRKEIDTNNWQMPQGGIEPKEKLEIAAKRELAEETGIKSIKIISQTTSWLYYDIPQEIRKNLWHNKYLGQKQQWFLMEFLGDDNEININQENQEFVEWRWENKTKILKDIIYFKKDIYSKIFKEFAKFL